MKSIALFLALFSTQLFAFDYSSYAQKSFSNAINTHKGDFVGDADIWISGVAFKYSAKIAFTKELREISPSRREFLDNWRKALGQDKSFTDLYQHEFLVKEGETEIWLPMQESVLPYMGEELKVGQEFVVYYLLTGLDHGEWVFLGTEFQAE